jgi:hypothetical protein
MLIIISLVLENLILLKSKALHIVDREFPPRPPPLSFSLVPESLLVLDNHCDISTGLLHQN